MEHLSGFVDFYKTFVVVGYSEFIIEAKIKLSATTERVGPYIPIPTHIFTHI